MSSFSAKRKSCLKSISKLGSDRAAGVYIAERDVPGTPIKSYGDALYWGIAAFSTAGIADAPSSTLAKAVGGAWIVIGSLMFFGAIVATVTSYFMRPVQTPGHEIIEAIEHNLEHLDQLTEDELRLLRETTDTLIENMERLKKQTKDAPGLQ